MEFGVLGPLAVRGDGEPAELAVGGGKRRALLARLLVDPNRFVPADRLIEDLWDGDPPPAAAQTLQSHISKLRGIIGADRIETQAGAYRLVVLPGELDAQCFETELEDARRSQQTGDLPAADARLGHARSMWRGPAFGEFGSMAWARSEAVRLEELQAEALDTWLELRLARENDRALVAESEASIADAPLRERRWAVLITALYRVGRQADALRTYERLRTTLREELGIEPSPDLQALERAVLEQDPTLNSPVRAGQPVAGSTSASTAAPVLPTGVTTFLLTDVVGSTRRWEEAPEAMAKALARHDELIGREVAANDGVLLKARGEGDSTFSVFRRASNASAAALAVRRALHDEPWPKGAELVVRQAIHTGEAIERDGDYYGQAVNRAARLRAVTGPDQILVSKSSAEVIADHLGDGVVLLSLGEHQLRDLARPEDVYELVDAGSRGDVVGSIDPGTSDVGIAAAVTPVPPADVPLPARLAVGPALSVGRASEETLILERFRLAEAGERRLVLVAGEPGIGKSTLVGRVARAAKATGATVLSGGCDEHLNAPYRPFAQALSHLVDHDRSVLADPKVQSSLTALAPLIPALRTSSVAADRSESRDFDSDRAMLFEAVAALLRAASDRHPVVLVLEDLHWADGPTLLMLRDLIRRFDLGGVLVLATYRQSDLGADHPLVEAIAALRRESGVERIALDGLDVEDARALLEHASGGPIDEAGEELARTLVRETHGNAFFLTEVVRDLAAPGSTGDASWRKADGPIALPESVREVVLYRVRGLGDDAARVLRTGAVIGREFDFELLAKVLDIDEGSLLDILDATTRAALVAEVDGEVGSYVFQHALIQTILYEQLSAARRQRAHREVAEALEVICGEQPGEREGELARHWVAGATRRDSAKVVQHAGRAGDVALARVAPNEAIKWYELAFGAMTDPDAIDGELHCDLLIGLGAAQRQAGVPGSRETLLDAARRAGALGDPNRLARAAIANNRAYTSARVGHVDHDWIELLEETIRLLPEGDSRERALVQAILAVELTSSPNTDERRNDLARDALAIAQRLDDDRTTIAIQILRNTLLQTPDRLAERVAAAESLLELARRYDDRVASFWASMRLGLASWQLGDLDGFDAHMVDFDAEVARTGQPFLHWVALMAHAARAEFAGDVAQAEQLADAGLEDGTAIGAPDALDIYGAELLMIRWDQGRLAELAPFFESVGDDLDEQAQYTFFPIKAFVAAESGDVEGARAVVDSVATAGFDVFSWNAMWLSMTSMFVRAVWRCRHPLAAELEQRLTPWRSQLVFEGPLSNGAVVHSLALLAAVQGHTDDAVAAFSEAAAVYARVDAPGWQARVRVDWAQALVLDPRDVDHSDEVHRLLAEAIEFADRVGFVAVSLEAEQLRAELEARSNA